MSIDDKQEKLYRERRLKDRITNNDSIKKMELDKDSFIKTNRPFIDKAEKKLKSCNDDLFDFIYKKFKPCNTCISKDEKINYLALNYPKRVINNFVDYKKEFRIKSNEKRPPKNRVVGWGVRFDDFTRENNGFKVREVKEKQSYSSQKQISDKIENKSVELSSKKDEEEIIEYSLSPKDLNEKLLNLDNDTFEIVMLLLGVPKSLEKEKKINYINDNYKVDRIENAIIHAKKIKP